ncbi:WbqC family protein [Desulforamulus ferrireducens]|uniref:WbqC-like protein family protein n=1 Tax=Desulforamulus ferrireducens TaxID=1833852 RepID=A0A1S6J004_9FIRM|nr:WbqC family protein [Desulforamulus ferrireducens]AQS60355.1 hypothetical protein B0537_15550 [Desulforamulus ferrireducens]
MRVAIHQPNYFPWSGYFYKMFFCDIFVFLDDVQYSKNSFINRNRIKTPNGASWLTVPVKASMKDKINEVTFAKKDWQIKHIKTLDGNYAKAPYYNKYREELFAKLTEPVSNLAELNINLLKVIAKWLEVPCQFVLSSEIGSNQTGDDRLIDIILKIGGTSYLSGRGGAKYQDENKFLSKGLGFQYYDFTPPLYSQLWGESIPGLSIIDMLFNCGEKSRDILLNK